MKPKKTQPKDSSKVQERDFFQTPNYATDLIIPYIPSGVTVWECASGNGKITKRLSDKNINAIETDLLRGFDFINSQSDFEFDLIITNPPFSLKKEFYNKCLSYKKPFALLIPVDLNQWLLNAIKNDDAKWLIPTRRIDYLTPSGKQGKNSSAQFHSGWLTVGLDLPSQITVVELSIKEKRENI